MTQTTVDSSYRSMRTLPMDVGVAILAVLALLAALLLRGQAEGQMHTFTSDQVPLQFAYPAGWTQVGTLDAPLLSVANPITNSPFKTTLTVDNRELDPAALPALEELTNRRIDERSGLTGYHFLSSGPTKVGGADATVIEYASVVQPIDEPRRPSLPVVVRTREYVVLAKDQSYYFTLVAPEEEFERVSQQMDSIIASVKL